MFRYIIRKSDANGALLELKMKSIEQGKSALRTTEKQLRELVAKAANEGEYDAVLTLTKWASQLAGLVNGYAAKPAGNGDAGRASLQKKSRQTKATRRRTKAVPSGYPKFVRLGNDLVKIGWSKKSKEEYQHRAPHGVLALLAESLRAAGANGNLVNAHDLMPLEDPETSSEIPSYQVYLCVAWLRQVGLVEQQGRQGYTVPGASDFPTLIEDCWAKLSVNGQ